MAIAAARSEIVVTAGARKFFGWLARHLDVTTFAKRGVPSSLILWSDIIMHKPRDTTALNGR